MSFFRRAGRAPSVRFLHNSARVSSKNLFAHASSPLLLSAAGARAPIDHLAPSLLLSFIRSFADKPAGRPKQHTGRTPARKPRATKSSTSTDSEAAATSKAVKPKKKVAKKAAKKAAPKKKPVKAKRKKLTEEEKERKAARDRAKLVTELRKATLKKEEPPRIRYSAWTQYVIDQTKDVKVTTLQESQQRMKTLVSSYRALSGEDREALNHRAKAQCDARVDVYARWVQSHSYKTIVEANAARRKLVRMKVVKSFQAIKDDRQPKRPRIARNYFLADRYASGDFKGVGLAEASRLIAREWADLPQSEKQRFVDLEKEDRTRYEREISAVQ